MTRRKTKCNSCNKESAQEILNIRFTRCKECGEYDIEEFHKLLALKMKETGFNWHDFADRIDELAKKGTAKELFIEDAETSYKKHRSEIESLKK